MFWFFVSRGNMWRVVALCVLLFTTARSAVVNNKFSPRGVNNKFSTHGKCSIQDKHIYRRMGREFSHRFRAFGGVTVSKSSYEEAVRHATGLSVPCSQCYGDAYICGYNNCFWSCSTEGASCDACLKKEGCIEACNKCTGFV
jgi:hypothetical protein